SCPARRAADGRALARSTDLHDAGVLPAVRRRCQPGRSLEEPAEEGRVLVAHLVADVVDGHAASLDDLSRLLDAHGVDVLHRPVPGRRAEPAREGPWLEAGSLGHRGYGIRDRVMLVDPRLARPDDRVAG